MADPLGTDAKYVTFHQPQLGHFGLQNAAQKGLSSSS